MMPQDAGHNGIVGTDHDERIPCDGVIARVLWRARPLCYFNRYTKQRYCNAEYDKPAKEFLSGNDAHWFVQDDKRYLDNQVAYCEAVDTHSRQKS